MLRKRGLILVTFSLVLGFGAAMVARGWVAEQSANDEPEGATVIAAAMAIPFGTKVEVRHLKTIEMPVGSVPPGSFALVDEVVDKVTTQPIVAGEILMKARFTDQGDGSTLAALVGKNMRAVTVRVDDVIGVAGFLLPGNRVDVGPVAFTPAALRAEVIQHRRDALFERDGQRLSVRGSTFERGDLCPCFQGTRWSLL